MSFSAAGMSFVVAGLLATIRSGAEELTRPATFMEVCGTHTHAIAAFQATQHKLADMATKIELSRLITYKAAWNYDQGRIDPKLTSMAKMYAARTAVEVDDEAIQLLGGYGYMTEYEVERFYRDAKITEIYEGTKEIQKNTIASAVIGKLK